MFREYHFFGPLFVVGSVWRMAACKNIFRFTPNFPAGCQAFGNETRRKSNEYQKDLKRATNQPEL